eukprot:TRINITY_DN8285_c0_g1_i1.p1 TRINITY_DN8285_c0_g1~~TRINITY_DN8285_c0_g1_i1.p1  ORF type:complete len:115 (-),score=3.20 TRINITY_DN8285_c0_g1_i1:621-965(-)
MLVTRFAVAYYELLGELPVAKLLVASAAGDEEELLWTNVLVTHLARRHGLLVAKTELLVTKQKCWCEELQVTYYELLGEITGSKITDSKSCWCRRRIIGDTSTGYVIAGDMCCW